MREPFRVKIVGKCIESIDTLKANAESCLGLARIEKQVPHGRKLAVVGGGLSTLDHLDELRNFDGDIWAINNTAAWLIERGIKATLFTVDPAPVDEFDLTGVDSALIATCCHPSLREAIRNVRLFDIKETDATGHIGGSSSSTRTPLVAVFLGYTDITYYGCEGSFLIDRDHVDRHEGDRPLLIVKAGGVEYLTRPDYMVQAEDLAAVMRMAPDIFKNRSGGLLQAMLEYPDEWEVVAVSALMKENIESYSGKCGLYETSYTPSFYMEGNSHAVNGA